ncbi:MAG: hypothetical protein WEB58_12890 [Planctomycetaceae bacterium]
MRPLTLRASLTLTAAGKQRRFKIVAYTGGKLHVKGFDAPVVIDLAGLRAAGTPSILIDHDDTAEATVGQVATIENDGRQLVLSGLVTGEHRPRVKSIIVQADAGHQWQASVGCLIDETALQTIQAGQTVMVNGQTFTGPVYISRRSDLRETSILSTGADSSTSVNLAAKAALQKEMKMDFTSWLETLGITDPDALTEENRTALMLAYDALASAPEAEPENTEPVAAGALVNLRARRAGEHRRISRIEAIASGHPQIIATAIEKGWTPEQTEISMLRAQRNPAPRSNGRGGSPSTEKVLTASLALTAGASADFLAKDFGQDTIDAATRQEHRGATFRTVMETVIRASGGTPPSHRVTDGFIRAAFEASRTLQAAGYTTMSLPGILSNAANKLLLQGFVDVKTTWQEFCAIGDLADFKEAKRYRMITGGEFLELPPAGNIKHLVLNQEETYTNQLKTYASMVQIDRTALVNDDLGAFESLPKSLGRLGAIKLEKVIYTLLLANGGNFFHTDNDNILTGAGSVLSIDALTAAEKLFLTRVDGNNDPIFLTPEVLLVPPALSVTANKLVRDTQVVAVGVGSSADTIPNGNPHAGRFVAHVSPWLENVGISGYSATGWYLLARPQGSSGLLEVGFLDGQRTPTIESGETNFDTLGIALRGYFDFGCAFQDGRFGVLNAGA